MTGRLHDLVVRLSDRLFDRLRHRQAYTVTDENAADGSLEALRGSRYALLVTFRRDGSPVPSPVWVACDAAGRSFVKTSHDAGKVKRLRGDARVVVAPSTRRGRPLGPGVRATGRLLSRDEWAHAESTLATGHGLLRRLSERLLSGGADATAYIEVTAPRRS